MKLNPHGDQAIYETMVRMARGNETLLHPYVDSKGNFGKAYSRDMAYAASRYTEVKLAKIAEEQISIIPRGAAGGYTLSVPEEDINYQTKNEMLGNIVTLLGGRVAEQKVLDDISTGASNDLERATAIARSMVTRYGFSDKLGPVVYGSQSEVFLGRDFTQSRNYSEQIATDIDVEIRNIVEECYDRCSAILEEHMDKLHEVANRLMTVEKIEGDEFQKLMKGEAEEAPEGHEAAAVQTEEETAAEIREEDSPAAVQPAADDVPQDPAE